MFENNWSAEQIEQELALKFHTLLQGEEGGAVPGSEPAGFMSNCAGVLEKMSDVLENQSLVRSEIRSLRDEVAALRRERDEAEASWSNRFSDLENQVLGLRSEREELLRMVQGQHHAADALAFPPAAFLAQPLVIRSSQGEYLGVLGKSSRHFSLRDFVELVQRNTDASFVDMKWKSVGAAWLLELSVRREGDVEKSIRMRARHTVTPSRNTVTLVESLNIDGQDVPDTLLLSLFRQVKESFGE